MRRKDLKPITVYLSDAEYKEILAEAQDYDLTISAYIRARLKLPEIKRGAPEGNKNRVKKKGKPANDILISKKGRK